MRKITVTTIQKINLSMPARVLEVIRAHAKQLRRGYSPWIVLICEAYVNDPNVERAVRNYAARTYHPVEYAELKVASR